MGPSFEAESHRPRLTIRQPSGEPIYTFGDSTPTALIWYPPERWQPGERITIETAALTLPRVWGITVNGKADVVLPEHTGSGEAIESSVVGTYADAIPITDGASTLVMAYARVDNELMPIPHPGALRPDTLKSLSWIGGISYPEEQSGAFDTSMWTNTAQTLSVARWAWAEQLRGDRTAEIVLVWGREQTSGNAWSSALVPFCSSTT